MPRPRKRSPIVVISLSLALSLLLGCTKKSSTKDAPPKWLRWGTAEMPAVADWTACRSSRCFQSASLVMEGLTRAIYEDGNARPVPALADTWKSPSPTEWVFHLKEKVLWSDGVPLHPDHFVGAWKKLLSDCRQNPRAELLFPIANAKAFCDGKLPFSTVGIKTSQSSIKFRLVSPHPEFPLLFSHPALWPSREGRDKVVPTLGRFRLESSTPLSVKFAPSPTYHGERPLVGGVEVKIVRDGGTRIQMFLDGELDLVDDIPHLLSGQLLGDPRLETAPTRTLTAIAFTGRRPLHQAALRRAFQESIDRGELVDLMRWPHYPTTRLFEPPSKERPRFNPSGAVKMLADLKLDLPAARAALHPTLASPSSSDSEEVARNLAAQWLRHLGIGVTNAAAASASFQIVSRSVSAFQRDRNLTELLPPSRHRDSLVEAVQSAKTPEALRKALAKIERWSVDDEAWIAPLFFEGRFMLRNPALRNLDATPLETWDFSEVTLD